MNPKLIAPCGMNCQLCRAYLREKNRCPGCRFMGKRNTSQGFKKYIRKCIIRNCNIIKKNNWKHCSPKCKNFPCQRLKSLDKRYITKYDFSMINNLKFIEEKGIKKFLEKQKKKYTKGNKVFCIHNKEYYDIGK